MLNETHYCMEPHYEGVRAVSLKGEVHEAIYRALGCRHSDSWQVFQGGTNETGQSL